MSGADVCIVGAGPAGRSVAVSLAGCRYAPLQPLDFTARPAVGTPGWDLDPGDLLRVIDELGLYGIREVAGTYVDTLTLDDES